MSLLQHVFRDMVRPLRILENHMRLREDVFQSFAVPFFRLQPAIKDDIVVQENDKLQIKLNVQDFNPSEISIKTLKDNSVEVYAKHEEKNDSGFISKKFMRRFVLPEGHDIKKLNSSLSSNGILTITAPKLAETGTEIPIIHDVVDKIDDAAKKDE